MHVVGHVVLLWPLLWSCDVGGASSVVSGIIEIHKIQLFPRALKQCFYTFLHFNIRVIACLWHMPKHLGLHNSAMKAAILQILSRSHTEISNESIADDARMLHLGADVLAHRVCDDKAYHFERGESRCHDLRVHFQLGQMHQLGQLLELGVHRDMSASWCVATQCQLGGALDPGWADGGGRGVVDEERDGLRGRT